MAMYLQANKLATTYDKDMRLSGQALGLQNRLRVLFQYFVLHCRLQLRVL